MTKRVTHLKVDAHPDGADASLVQPSDWNTDHVVDIDSTGVGAQALHGVESMGALSFNATSHVLSVAGPNAYWFQGVRYSTAGAVTCDLDDFETLTANTLYFFYFDDASGTLKCSDEFWNLKAKVPVATVYWNGAAGALSGEKHSYTRDIDWHIWAHLTVGCRYESGLALTKPTTADDATLAIGGGTLYDEDIGFTVVPQSTMRGWFKASASKYTFADYALPYLGTAGHCFWLDTDDYTLKDADHSKYVCYWLYGSTDQDRPIYVVPTHAADPYNTVALARAETAPALSGLGLTPELKLIYRLIYRGDGELQEVADYRLTSPLPSGGTAAVTAAAVAFAPAGSIAATTVQTALEELDSETLKVSDQFLGGAGVDTTVTLTNAATAYAIPASTPTAKYTLLLYNGSDTDMFLRFTTGTTAGQRLPAGANFTIDLGANQGMFAYCASAGKVLNVSYKEVA